MVDLDAHASRRGLLKGAAGVLAAGAFVLAPDAGRPAVAQDYGAGQGNGQGGGGGQGDGGGRGRGGQGGQGASLPTAGVGPLERSSGAVGWLAALAAINGVGAVFFTQRPGRSDGAAEG